jgi:hypothetical protein
LRALTVAVKIKKVCTKGEQYYSSVLVDEGEGEEEWNRLIKSPT